MRFAAPQVRPQVPSPSIASTVAAAHAQFRGGRRLRQVEGLDPVMEGLVVDPATEAAAQAADPVTQGAETQEGAAVPQEAAVIEEPAAPEAPPPEVPAPPCVATDVIVGPLLTEVRQTFDDATQLVIRYRCLEERPVCCLVASLDWAACRFSAGEHSVAHIAGLQIAFIRQHSCSCINASMAYASLISLSDKLRHIAAQAV